MSLTNFCWGFVGGFIIQAKIFIDSFDLKNMAQAGMAHATDQNDETPVSIADERVLMKKLFSPLRIFLIIFSATIGGIMAYLIDPQITFFALYIGLTSSGFISKFH